MPASVTPRCLVLSCLVYLRKISILCGVFVDVINVLHKIFFKVINGRIISLFRVNNGGILGIHIWYRERQVSVTKRFVISLFCLFITKDRVGPLKDTPGTCLTRQNIVSALD